MRYTFLLCPLILLTLSLWPEGASLFSEAHAQEAVKKVTPLKKAAAPDSGMRNLITYAVFGGAMLTLGALLYLLLRPRTSKTS